MRGNGLIEGQKRGSSKTTLDSFNCTFVLKIPSTQKLCPVFTLRALTNHGVKHFLSFQQQICEHTSEKLIGSFSISISTETKTKR